MSQHDEPHDRNEFLSESEAERTSLVAEFIDFLKHNKKWWMIPILLALVFVIVVALLATTSAAPFIYPLF